MRTPVGGACGLYVDIPEPIDTGDAIVVAKSLRSYVVTAVRVQERGRHRGRQHLRVVVVEHDDIPATAIRHLIRWYRR